jgi:hypothetical protein
LLRKFGATGLKPQYGIARPLDWPNIARNAADQVEQPASRSATR